MGSFAIEKAPSPLPALYVTLPESDLDDEVEEVIFCFDVTDSVVVMDTLQNSSALIVAKMKNTCFCSSESIGSLPLIWAGFCRAEKENHLHKSK